MKLRPARPWPRPDLVQRTEQTRVVLIMRAAGQPGSPPCLRRDSVFACGPVDLHSPGANGGPTLTCPWAAKIAASSSADGRGASAGGNVAAVAFTDASRIIRSRPAGVLRTNTCAVSLSTRNV